MGTKKRVSLTWALAVLLVFSLAVNIWALTQERETTFGPEAAENPSPDNTGKEKAVARVGDHVITEAQWLRELKNEHGAEVLEIMINRYVVAQTANELGITVDEELLQKEMEMAETSGHSAHEEPMEPEELKEELTYNYLLEEIATRDVHIPEEEVRAYYEENKPYFNDPERVHLHQIVVETKEEAQQVVEELKNGSPFATLAKEHSTDILFAEAGGDLGWVPVPYLDEPLMTAVRELSLEEISDPIPVEGGYAVIKISERAEEKKRSYDEVKDIIRRELAMQEVQTVNRVLEDLKKNMEIEIKVELKK